MTQQQHAHGQGGHQGRANAPRATSVLACVAVLAAVVLVALTTPWTAAPVVTDPTAGLSAEQLAVGERLRATLRVTTVVSVAVTLLSLAAVALTPAGRRLLDRVAQPLDGRPMLQGAWVALVLVVGVEVVRLPAAVWRERVLTDAGLSTRSWVGWARDLAVQLLLESGVLVAAVLVLLLLVRTAPRWWPVLAATAAGAAVVLLSAVYPLVVEPAFNEFEPLPAGQLRTDVLALAAEADVDVTDVLVADASRRSTAANAYVSGVGPTRRVVLHDTLLELGDDVVLSVLAHELGHVRAADVVRGTLTGALAAAAVVLVLGASLQRATSGRPGRRRPARLVAVGLLVLTSAQVAAVPVESLLSRQVERRADAYALALLRSSGTGTEQFVTTMRLLAVRNLADPAPPGWAQWWFGTHPTTAERVATGRSVDRS